MKNYIAILGLSVVFISCGSVKSKANNDLALETPIKTSLDLTKVVNDRVPVTIDPGRFTAESVTYRMPRIIQGTYTVSDFGKYIEDMKALDYEGNTMEVNQIDVNTWTISDATKLDKLIYYVNDTFDTETSIGIGGENPFSPAGTNIEEDNYVLNLHGFIGYFDMLKANQYTLEVTAPSNFIKTSALEEIAVKNSEDGTVMTSSYFAPRYFDITDNPMMYGKVDVEEFMVGDIKVVLSVYSPNKIHTAASQKETVYKMMQAQKVYLGDINSTTRYDIYLYLSDGSDDAPKGMGALEHHTSTVVVLPESSSKMDLAKSITDVVAHEFFHIVTPLSVHSEDVHYFDYNTPTFSKHLWMYEGVTEYFAQHFQVHQGLVSSNEFYNTIKGKIAASKNLDDTMSFTHMSENVLEQPYAANYYNVYLKGALIGMCIDILMREESNGTRSILSLMKELSLKYGKNKPFNDDEIIEEITGMTYPSVGEFLNTHVINSAPIIYEDFFKKVGLKQVESTEATNYIFAGGQNFIFDVNGTTGDVAFSPTALKNSFWASQGIKVGDVIKKVNGAPLNLQSLQQVIGGMFLWQKGQKYDLELERDGEIIQLKGTLEVAEAVIKSLEEDENATEAQKALRAAWLKG
ncbi:MAG: peptidase M61 [Flavobacteriaceae bacterium]|nr:peptidase M61 [Flavobacteriaceae bacterium]